MHLSAFLQFKHFTDCSIKEYQPVLDELRSVFTYYTSIMPA